MKKLLSTKCPEEHLESLFLKNVYFYERANMHGYVNIKYTIGTE